jgi:hypothetical protein
MLKKKKVKTTKKEKEEVKQIDCEIEIDCEINNDAVVDKVNKEGSQVKFEQIVLKGCGLDVHKETVVATIAGEGLKEETKTFETFTENLEELRDWLKSNGVSHVAMESTGVYWKPIYNILEADFEVLLVNARHIKNVPGKKTDKKAVIQNVKNTKIFIFI